MKISTLILMKIIEDADFSRRLSEVLHVKQISVEITAKRTLKNKSMPVSLMRPAALKFYNEQGLTEEEIFEHSEQPAT